MEEVPVNAQWEWVTLTEEVFGWLLCWIALYLVMAFGINKSKRPEYNCRINTLVHAVVMTSVAAHVLFFSGTNPWQIWGSHNTKEQDMILEVSLGYFLFDLVWCLYSTNEGGLMVAHHLCSIFFLALALYLRYSGTEVIATMFGSELTSIVLNIRWFMKEHGLYSKPMVGIAIDAIFISMFCGVRMVLGGIMLHAVWMDERVQLCIKLGGTSFYMINFLFYSQIVSFAKYRLNRLMGWTNQVWIEHSAGGRPPATPPPPTPPKHTLGTATSARSSVPVIDANVPGPAVVPTPPGEETCGGTEPPPNPSTGLIRAGCKFIQACGCDVPDIECSEMPSVLPLPVEDEKIPILDENISPMLDEKPVEEVSDQAEAQPPVEAVSGSSVNLNQVLDETEKAAVGSSENLIQRLVATSSETAAQILEHEKTCDDVLKAATDSGSL